MRYAKEDSRFIITIQLIAGLCLILTFPDSGRGGDLVK